LDLSSRPKVLVIDDGELGRIRDVFREFDVDLQHLRGQVIREDLEGDFDVVVATVKRILDLEGAVDLTDLAGKPTWIAVHGQDFLPLRVRLQKMGVDYLVQSSVGIEALRLLLIHTLYQGPEKRGDARLPVGATVTYSKDGGSPSSAELLDLTRSGCRLVAANVLNPGETLSVDLPSQLAGGEALSLPGRVLREDLITGSDAHLMVVEFGEIDPDRLELLDAILEGKVIGTLVTRLGSDLSEDTVSLTIPSAAESKETPSPEAAETPQNEYPHQRFNPRVAYTRQVTMLLGGGEHVILGRDLSIEGMRAEPIPELAVGTQLELAIYGTSGAEPVLVQAVVARDDGPLGTVFRFESMANWDRPRLEKIIETTVKILSLSSDEAGAPVVVSRLTKRNG
jgi:hypothetical protein